MTIIKILDNRLNAFKENREHYIEDLIRTCSDEDDITTCSGTYHVLTRAKYITECNARIDELDFVITLMKNSMKGDKE